MKLQEMPFALSTRQRWWLVLQHSFFTRGTGFVARFRGWDRLGTYRESHSLVRRLRLLFAYATMPPRAVVQAWRGVREHGARVATRHGISRRRQFADLCWLRVAYGVLARSYYLFGLYLPERRRRAGRFLQIGELDRMYRVLVARTSPGDAAVFADKRRFAAWCDRECLPNVAALLELEDGAITRSVLESGRLPECDLFSKPANWRAGFGTCTWHYAGNRRWVGGDDAREYDEEELVAELARRSQALRRPMLLQRRLRNHASLLPLTGGGFGSTRLFTYRPPIGGEPRVLLATHKMPVGDVQVDAIDSGSVIAPIDLASGRLGLGFRVTDHVVEPCPRHPDSGAEISGTEMPHWPEAVDLVLRAHRAAGAIVFVGWDVAMLDGGPRLVEGNRYPGAKVSQIASGIPLGDTPLVECFDAYLRHSFGLPPYPSASGRTPRAPSHATADAAPSMAPAQFS
jgi:hypothetical protein